MIKQSLLLVGAGGHAKACIDVIEQNGRFDIIGLLGLPEQSGKQILGYPVIGTDDTLKDLRTVCSHALVTVGQIKSSELRIRLFTLLLQYDFFIPDIISPHAYVSSHAKLGVGTIVMHGAIVNAGAVVGCNCILNSQSLIEHDVIVGDHCHISTAAVINGDSVIEDGTFIGSGSVIRESTKVSARSVIGMGQLIKDRR